eukprot:5425290-Alexandrium_andersonii.AAC.1
MSLYRNAVHALAEAQRHSIEGNGQAAWALTLRYCAKLDAPTAQIMRRIHMMGVWTQHSLARMAATEPEPCPWCQKSSETLTHLWWECERFHPVRQRICQGPAPDHQRLPPLLKHAGVAPQMLYKHGAAFWGDFWGDAPEGA